MSILAWIVLGLIAGFIGSKIVNRQGEGVILDIVLGIVGAVAGGWLAGFFGLAGVSGLIYTASLSPSPVRSSCFSYTTRSAKPSEILPRIFIHKLFNVAA